MANPSVTNTFVANTTATAASMNTNFTDIISGLSSGSTWDVVTSSLTTTDLTVSEDVEFTYIPEFLKDLDLDGNDGCKGSFISQVDSAPGSSAFIGGVVLPSGKVFCVPFNYSGTDYVFNPSTGEFETQTDSAPGSGAFYGGVLLPNGKVFCVPSSYSGTDYVFNPASGEFETQTDSAPGSGAFSGGVLLPNGKVFCVPIGYSGTDYVFNAGATTKSAEPWCYHPMFNKF